MNYTVIGYRLGSDYHAIPVEAESILEAEKDITDYYKKLEIYFTVAFIIEGHPIIHRIKS